MTTIIAAPPSPDLDALLPDDPVALAAVANAVAVKLAALPLAASTEGELLAAAESLEQARRRFDAADAAVLVEISDRGAYRTAGYLSLHAYLSGGLRVGDGAARRRRVAAAAIGRFTNMLGQTLEPRCPATAVAVADGQIGVDHVLEIDAVLTRIPAAVTTDVRERAEAQLAAVARTLTPAGVRTAGVRLLAHLDPDGQLTDDRDRRRLRGLALMPQDRQLMSALRTRLTPGLRADLEIMLQSWAAPGMNNPDDPASPTGAMESADPAVVAAAAERDDRTPMQRNHDALHALLILARQQSPASGSLRSELVVTITDAELAAHAGIALTATGTRVPISELVRLAADATPHLAVFAHTTGEPLYLGRGRRLASRAQRLMLFARDRGCTAPRLPGTLRPHRSPPFSGLARRRPHRHRPPRGGLRQPQPHRRHRTRPMGNPHRGHRPPHRTRPLATGHTDHRNTNDTTRHREPSSVADQHHPPRRTASRRRCSRPTGAGLRRGRAPQAQSTQII
ncbi:DUF222 domain-containing protein [Gordonia shandongensis]|uniref:DUF222 domain-containing protein n=1 Tax=Gordonia shandongensis TaxID=376351 RepID=UPI00316AD7A3